MVKLRAEDMVLQTKAWALHQAGFWGRGWEAVSKRWSYRSHHPGCSSLQGASPPLKGGEARRFKIAEATRTQHLAATCGAVFGLGFFVLWFLGFGVFYDSTNGSKNKAIACALFTWLEQARLLHSDGTETSL